MEDRLGMDVDFVISLVRGSTFEAERDAERDARGDLRDWLGLAAVPFFADM